MRLPAHPFERGAPWEKAPKIPSHLFHSLYNMAKKYQERQGALVLVWLFLTDFPTQLNFFSVALLRRLRRDLP